MELAADVLFSWNSMNTKYKEPIFVLVGRCNMKAREEKNWIK